VVNNKHQLNDNTQAAQRRLVGNDHTDTLAAAGNLAFTLDNIGEHAEAVELEREVLATEMRVSHPRILNSCSAACVNHLDLLLRLRQP
jgi:hypothetical protein